MKYEIEYIEKIAKIVADNNLTEITLEDGEQAIVVRKEANVIATSAPVVAPIAPAAAPVSAPVASVAPAAKEEKTSAPASKGSAITSPMVGAFYAECRKQHGQSHFQVRQTWARRHLREHRLPYTL